VWKRSIDRKLSVTGYEVSDLIRAQGQAVLNMVMQFRGP
jgi:hypothetical protein